MSEPSNGEVMRELARVAGELQSLAQQMREDRMTAADTYVRKDVHDLTVANHMTRIRQLETENADRDKASETLRRQLLVGLILAAVPALVGLILGLNNLLASGGVTT